ncbi:F-box protein At1g70590 isoform X2 [Physcomitrium patens]|nr:F-box protein At1g70590-like isoform X2 [Physcomitrium patens]|eukprot:XP_024397842.1 F-box protein At1g70590-like isoform X2 [Physcomitrella patens]
MSSSDSQRRMRFIHSNVVGTARNHRQRYRAPREDSCTEESSPRMSFRSSHSDRNFTRSWRCHDRDRNSVHENVAPLYSIPSFSRKAISPNDSHRLGDEPGNDLSGFRRGTWAERNSGARLKEGDSSRTLWSVKAMASSDVASSAAATATSLPFDVLQRIAGSFSWHDLWNATCTCKTWNKALAPLREGMLFLHYGKKFKHGHEVSKNLDKALQMFTKGAIRGCAAAMVDAGLLLWEMGRRDEGINWYKQAAELRHPAGMCNLGLAYLQDSNRLVEAVKWLKIAATAGHVRAQYSLALCLQQGKGVECNMQKAARWYLQAAEGGSTRGMYNVALCLRSGEGFSRNLYEAKRWMRRAAVAGHSKAQFEFGLTLFAEGEGGSALVFLELATRAGETGATHIRDALLVQLPSRLRAHALACADKFQNGGSISR